LNHANIEPRKVEFLMTDSVQQHPQKVLQTAARLFQTTGYTATTLSQIAIEADIALDTLQQQYAHKEKIALALYHVMAEETQHSIRQIEEAHLARRYVIVMKNKIGQLQPHAEAMAALFATAMLPHSDITTAHISPGTADPMYQAFLQLVQEAQDTPSTETDSRNLAMLLYTFHFLILVFWVYDRTVEKKATHLLIEFMGELFKVLRPMMMMPLFGKAITKLAHIMMLVFGGARWVEEAE
jgi:AcrR family transcriptional regulator